MDGMTRSGQIPASPSARFLIDRLDTLWRGARWRGAVAGIPALAVLRDSRAYNFDLDPMPLGCALILAGGPGPAAPAPAPASPRVTSIPGSATGGKVPGSPEPRAGAPAPPPLIAKDSALMGSPGMKLLMSGSGHVPCGWMRLAGGPVRGLWPTGLIL
jgi:hypothetical protein